jgi:hypothetical protein
LSNNNTNDPDKFEKAVTVAEQVIANLRTKQSKASARVEEIAAARKKLGFAVHATGDKDARTRLDKLNLEDAALAGELQSLDGALTEADQRLRQAQRAQACETERAQIVEQRKLNDEYRKLGKWLDEAADDWIAGCRGALSNSRALAHPGSAERVLIALMRVLRVKVRGTTALERELGVSDSNDARSFPSYQQVFEGRCASNEREYAQRLAALDGEQTKTEAA